MGCSGANGHFNNKNAADGKPVTGDVALTGTGNSCRQLSLDEPNRGDNREYHKGVAHSEGRQQDNACSTGAVPALTYVMSGFVGGETLATSDVGGSAACSTASGNVAGSFPDQLRDRNVELEQLQPLVLGGHADGALDAGSCSGGPIGNPILQPVNNDGSSTFKQGSTVPLKFRACDANGNFQSDPRPQCPTSWRHLFSTIRRRRAHQASTRRWIRRHLIPRSDGRLRRSVDLQSEHEKSHEQQGPL